MTRPETYHDWRALWHQWGKALGWHIHLNMMAGRPLMDRYTWEVHDRLRRIWLRMDAEAAAGTRSYCRAVLQTLEKWMSE